MEKGRIEYELLLIGGSAGSLEVLIKVLPQLEPSRGFAIVLVLHRKSGDSLLTNLLSDKTHWEVKEAEEKESIIAGTIYIAPADYHLLIEKDKTFSLDYSEKLHYSRPGIDASFETGSEAYGSALVALLLSGANADGAAGLKKVYDAGGLALIQDPAEASVSYMPQQAINLVSEAEVLSTEAIVSKINSLNS